MKRKFWIALTLAAAIMSGCGSNTSETKQTYTYAVQEETTGTIPEAETAAMQETPEESASSKGQDENGADESETQAELAETEEEKTAETSPGTETGESTVQDGTGLEVHFIDVGQADSALILCDGASMLIDGGNAEDSDLLYTYLKNLSVDYLDYVVCTHAHEDHVGGLAGALNYATAGTALCPVTDYDSRAFESFVSCLNRQGVSITVPEAGDSFQLGGATVDVLGPVRPDAEEQNNTSIVLRVVYGDTSFLFTGDAEREEEQDILDAGYTLDSSVLKVGHHGSANSTTYPFLREVMPEYAVISVGAGNSYGHPTEEALSRLRDAGATVFRTDMQGDIICRSDGKSVRFSVSRNADADTFGGIGPNSAEAARVETESANTEPGDTRESSEASYVLNTNTHKFHYPDCSSVAKMKEENKSYFTGTRDEVISMGYEPCGNCKP